MNATKLEIMISKKEVVLIEASKLSINDNNTTQNFYSASGSKNPIIFYCKSWNKVKEKSGKHQYIL